MISASRGKSLTKADSAPTKADSAPTKADSAPTNTGSPPTKTTPAPTNTAPASKAPSIRAAPKRTSAQAERAETPPDVQSPPLAELRDDYLRERRVEGIRDTTLRMYNEALRLFENWARGEGVLFAHQIKTKHIQDFLLSQMARKLSERTVRNRAIVLKGMLKFAYKEGYLASERLYDWKLPKMARAQVYMPDLSEVGVILAAIPEHWSAALNPRSRFRNAEARTFFSRRDQAIVGVQVSTGLRISETLGLRLIDLSAEPKTLTVTHSKTGKPRAVPVGEALASLLQAWLRVRPKTCPTDLLFVTEFGTQLHRDAWGHSFQRYLAFARAQGHPLPRVTLHSLRHVAGTAMAEHDLYHASLMLGHSSVQITANTYLHARADQIRSTHEAADPLAQIMSRGRKKAGQRSKVI